MRDITQRFVYKALPDAIGMRVEGREHMYAFSHMVWATMGPENELFHEAMVDFDPVLAWLEECCNRDNLAARRHRHGAIYDGRRGRAHAGRSEASSADGACGRRGHHVLTMANAMRAFALFPGGVSQAARPIRTLVRAAFDESLRWDSPSRMAGRITTRDVEIEGYRVPAGQRVGLMFAAANRDPRAWTEPDRFDIEPRPAQTGGLGLRRARLRQAACSRSSRRMSS